MGQKHFHRQLTQAGLTGPNQPVGSGCQALRWCLYCLIFLAVAGCGSESIQVAGGPREFCRVCETIYEHGPQIYSIIVVHSNGTYTLQDFDPSPRFFSHHQSVRASVNGRLSSEVLASLEESIHSDPHWQDVDGTPTCYVEVDDSLTRYPEPVTALTRYVRLAQLQGQAFGPTNAPPAH
jgi:hypothetical protein